MTLTTPCLAGIRSVYVPCLRTDELVFKLADMRVRQRLEVATDVSLSGIRSLREALARLFARFIARGARACAISLPPDFSPTQCRTGGPRRPGSIYAVGAEPVMNATGVRCPILCSGRSRRCVRSTAFLST